jgi:hypothetical protein
MDDGWVDPLEVATEGFPVVFWVEVGEDIFQYLSSDCGRDYSNDQLNIRRSSAYRGPYPNLIYPSVRSLSPSDRRGLAHPPLFLPPFPLFHPAMQAAQ